MKKYRKTLVIIACFVLLIITNLFLFNWDALNNILRNLEQKTYLPSELLLSNWENGEDKNILLSKQDPIIELPDVDKYVSDIFIAATLPEDREYCVQIFWKDAESSDYTEDNSIFELVSPAEGGLKLKLNRPVTYLRLDLTEDPGLAVGLDRIILNSTQLHYPLWAFILPALIVVLLYYLFFVTPIVPLLWRERKIVYHMAENDLQARYAGSALGVFWAFAQPIMTMVVLWFVFQVGLRQQPLDNVPFILWFAAGYIPWICISDVITASMGCLTEYSYLVKKIQFHVEILPIIKIISAVIVHLAFWVFLAALFLYYQYPINFYWFQLIYYLICMIVHVTGLAFICASLAVFLKDFGQIIALLLQLFFWVSPVVWAPENMIQSYLPLLKLNPLYYIIQGYRNSLIYSVAFWDDSRMMILFWIFSVGLLVIGTSLFQKLKPHFPDLL